MLAQFADMDPVAAWTDFANVAHALFSAYRATRIATSLDDIRRLRLPARLGESAPLVDEATLASIDPDVVPWVANELALGGTEWCWGSAPVRRMAAVLITWINTAAAASTPEIARDLYAAKQKVSHVRAEAERVSPSSGAFETLFLEELGKDGASVADALRAGEPPLADRRPGRDRDGDRRIERPARRARELSDRLRRVRTVDDRATPRPRCRTQGIRCAPRSPPSPRWRGNWRRLRVDPAPVVDRGDRGHVFGHRATARPGDPPHPVHVEGHGDHRRAAALIADGQARRCRAGALRRVPEALVASQRLDVGSPRCGGAAGDAARRDVRAPVDQSGNPRHPRPSDPGGDPARGAPDGARGDRTRLVGRCSCLG